MKKIILIFILSVFLYSCSEIILEKNNLNNSWSIEELNNKE